ncbi:INSulin related [Caenorhabditis elegans]|uniref:INSulin related n=1 Tax=Caenorhabditis elegans TaxID=6239 RepID=Q7JP83_CAEEL|nr:INSulin related [Caenorhabditis elegans]CCD71046.1 INSulin related [Caenorhabditis elegans]|eukprot:NP_001022154.1 INSulin related [Caenorhabditis elegans]
MKLLPLIVVFALLAVISESYSGNDFQPRDNKHHSYRSCGESLSRRVAFLCNGGAIQTEILRALDCCSTGCTDKQIFSWCDFRKLTRKEKQNYSGLIFRNLNRTQIVSFLLCHVE